MKILLSQAMLALGALTVLIGCGQSHEQRFHTAPQKESELGLIAMGVEEETKDKLLEAHPESQYRLLSKSLKLYEFRNISKESILKLAPNARVQRNYFNKPNASQLDKKLKSQMDQGSPKKFTQGCIPTSRLPMPKLKFTTPESDTGNSSPISVVGDIVEVSLETAPESKGKHAFLITAPRGSNNEALFTENSSTSIKFDMPGSHAITVMYRRGNYCNTFVSEIPVVLNEPYKINEATTFPENKKRALEDLTFYHLDAIKAQKANAILNSKHKVKVAIIDSGVNYNHPGLHDKMWINNGEIPGDGIDNDRNGYVDDIVGYDFALNDNTPMDDVGHGSHIAGLIAGTYTGVAPNNVEIMGLKVGISLRQDVATALEALAYAIDNKADIINMSFGGVVRRQNCNLASKENKQFCIKTNELLDVEHEIHRIAEEQGLLLVVASGNEDTDVDHTPMLPARYSLIFDNVLTIGASNEKGQMTGYSNYGKNSVHMVAPGGYQAPRPGENGPLFSAYVYNPKGFLLNPAQGTSMATPVAAGVAALVLSANPNLSPAEVIQILGDTGTYNRQLERYTRTSKMVNALEAVKAARVSFNTHLK